MTYTVLFVLGTRPEAIKLAPVIRAARADSGLRVRVLATAQHRDLLDQALRPFGITPHIDLNAMRAGQSLPDLTSLVLTGLDRALAQKNPDIVLVQGDTTTVFAASLAAFYRRVPVGHVEAGLRSHDLDNPFPEEGNRKLTTQLAALHFAPTPRARENLLAEGVPADRITVTGNTVIDALHWAVALPDLPTLSAVLGSPLPDGARLALVTLHRRESWGDPLAGICSALRLAVDDTPSLHLLFPVHPQPRVREIVTARLAAHPRIHLVDPLDYLHFVACMRESWFVVTDSGGIQEEAPALGKPALVLRAVTERPEAVEAGTSALIGTQQEDVYRAVASLATDDARREQMATAVSPFGDGRASERIVAAVNHFARGRMSSAAHAQSVAAR